MEEGEKEGEGGREEERGRCSGLPWGRSSLGGDAVVFSARGAMGPLPPRGDLCHSWRNNKNNGDCPILISLILIPGNTHPHTMRREMDFWREIGRAHV